MHTLFQGTVAYNGKDIAFRVAETEQKQIQISVSFVKNSNVNQAKFEFNKVKENHWTLERTKTKSEINLDLKFDSTNGRWIFGTDNLMGVGNIEMVLKKKQEDLESEEKTFGNAYYLTIEKDGKELENLTEIQETEGERESKYEIEENRIEDLSNAATINDDGKEIHLDLDKAIKSLTKNMKPVRKFFTLPVVKGLCNDLERTIVEQAARQIKSYRQQIDSIQEKISTEEQINPKVIKTTTQYNCDHENQKNTFLQKITNNIEKLQNKPERQII